MWLSWLSSSSACAPHPALPTLHGAYDACHSLLTSRVALCRVPCPGVMEVANLTCLGRRALTSPTTRPCSWSAQVAVFLLQTLPQLDPLRITDRSLAHKLDRMWFWSEATCIFVFTIEYLGRIFTAPMPLKWARQFMNIIDLFAIFPFYVHAAVEIWRPDTGEDTSGLVVTALLRVLRLVRAFRILKLGKYFTTLRLVAETMRRSSTALITLLFIALLINVIFSAAIYYAEGVGGGDSDFCWTIPVGGDVWQGTFATKEDDHYDYCKGFESIPASMWWTLVTITTLGYGDVYPRTGFGKLVGTFTALSGILALALPITVVGANFTQLYDEHEKMRKEQLINKMGHRLMFPLEGKDRTMAALWRRGFELAVRYMRKQGIGHDIPDLDPEFEKIENARSHLCRTKKQRAQRSREGRYTGTDESVNSNVWQGLDGIRKDSNFSAEEISAHHADRLKSFRVGSMSDIGVDTSEAGTPTAIESNALVAEIKSVVRRWEGAVPGGAATVVVTHTCPGEESVTVVVSSHPVSTPH
mmetsp:Transcript_17108/g.54617  ORF Transcript_17108/g.54617 Transcript_17108/m.54617 type:complete len:528 (+) Transcript_17108:411-1994(+)